MKTVAVQVSGFEPVGDLRNVVPSDPTKDALDRLALLGWLEPMAFEVTSSAP